MMRRAFRVIIAGACMLSIVLCAGAGWLWWRSYRVPAAVEFDRRTGRWRVASDTGRVWVDNNPQLRRAAEPAVRAREERVKAEERLSAQEKLATGLPADSPEYAIAALELERRRSDLFERHMAELQSRARASGTLVAGGSVSHTVPVTGFAVPPLLWLGAAGRRRLVARRRRRLGRCVSCGYDLRGGHSACPECGRVT